MPERPLLPGFFRVIPMGVDAVSLRSAGRVIRISAAGAGAAVASFLADLDGGSGVAELAHRNGIGLDVATALITRLHDEGLIDEGLIDEGLIDEGLIDEGLIDEGLIDEGVADEGLIDEGLIDEGLADEGLADEGGADDGVTEDSPIEGSGGGHAGSAAQRLLFAELGGPGRQAQPRISAARVAIVGLGPVARIAARHLSASGISELVLVDTGAVTALDQAILAASRSWIGRPRTEAAAAELRCRTGAGGTPGTGTSATPECAALSTFGGPAARAWRPGPGIDLVVLEVDDAGTRAELFNRACLGAGVPFLAHETSTFRGLVGPTVRPGRDACYECARARRLSHLRHYDEQVAYDVRVRAGALAPLDAPLLAGSAALLGGLVSVEALRVIGGFQPSRTLGAVLVADLVTSEVRREAVSRVPACPACGTAEEEVDLGIAR